MKTKVAGRIYLVVIVVLVTAAGWLLIPATRNHSLIQALEAKDGARVRELLAQGADANTPVYREVSPLIYRLFGPFLRANFAPWIGDTPLELAVEQGVDTDTIRALLENGAKVNVTDGYGTSPLVKAANEGRADVVKLLLEHGADPNVSKAHYGPWTALMGAAEKGDAESVRLLLNHGADPNIKDKYRDPLALAKGHPEIVILLKKAGAK